MLSVFNLYGLGLSKASLLRAQRAERATDGIRQGGVNPLSLSHLSLSCSPLGKQAKLNHLPSDIILMFSF